MKPLFEKKQLFLYTFTYYHSATPEEVWTNYATAWNRFRTSAVKRFGRFSYCRVLEHHHKSPYPHLHIIADKEFPPTWLNRELIAAGFGYQANAQRVTSTGAAIYICKYLTKPWTDEYCKRIRKSLRLRIVSFGGDACRPEYTDSGWRIIARAFLGEDVLDCIAADINWRDGPRPELTYEKSIGNFTELTYIIGKGGLDAFDIGEILPTPGS
jgi:hypothetical protein